MRLTADDGKKRYAWTESTKSTTHGSSSGHKMEASKQLTRSQAAVENAKFATWSSNLFHAAFVSGCQQKALPPGPSGPLAICDMERTLDREQWEQAKGNLAEAMCCLRQNRERRQKVAVGSELRWRRIVRHFVTWLLFTCVLVTLSLHTSPVLRQSYICIQSPQEKLYNILSHQSLSFQTKVTVQHSILSWASTKKNQNSNDSQIATSYQKNVNHMSKRVLPNSNSQNAPVRTQR